MLPKLLICFICQVCAAAGLSQKVGLVWLVYLCIIVHFLIERLILFAITCINWPAAMSENEMEDNSMREYGIFHGDQWEIRDNSAEELVIY